MRKSSCAIPPQHFTAESAPGWVSLLYSGEEELKRWIEIVDAIWEEYIKFFEGVL